MTDLQTHYQQTIDRLVSIKQQLSVSSTFESAARELLEWCSDIRAFQPHFEQTLFDCLTVVKQTSGEAGFDPDLGYRLLAVCAAHRDKFSPNNAALVSTWCEQLGRHLLVRHDGTMNQSHLVNGGGGGGGPTSLLPQQMQKMMPSGDAYAMGGYGGNNGYPDAAAMWQQGGGGGGRVPGGAPTGVSVVTTVWGGVPPVSQTAPYSQNPLSPSYTNTTMSQMPQGFSGQMPKAGMGGYGGPPQAVGMAYARQPGPGGAYGRHGPYPAGGQQGPPPEALSAAAFAAAAATATATATATAMMGVQQDRQQQAPPTPHMNVMGHVETRFPAGSPYMHPAMERSMSMDPQQQQQAMMQQQQQRAAMQQRSLSMDPSAIMGGGGAPGEMGVQTPAPGPMSARATMYGPQRRPSPYPANPQAAMQARKAAAQKQAMYQQGFGPNGAPYGGGVNGGDYPMAGGYGPMQGRQQPMAGYRPGSYMQQGYTGPMGPGRPPMGYPNGGAPYGGQAGYNAYYGQQMMQGQPTPPITPGNLMPPFGAAPMQADIKPQGLGLKDGDELRLTFPVRDGVVLPPFRLEHNLSVSNHVFYLREQVYYTLMQRPDLELQLKCFHHEDRSMGTNWPASVTVSVNTVPLLIDRGDSRTMHRPLYFKDVCQPGNNKLQITVSACCCSHLFILQLVHRPSIKSVLQGLLRKRLLPAEHCIAKIKRNFSSVAPMNNAAGGGEDVEQTAIKVSLKCPITFRRIVLPARGHECKHIQCFDLESYLQMNSERGTWRCPLCSKPALLEGLEIDQYVWAILENVAGTDFEEVTIDQTASWKPVIVKVIKEEENSTCGQRWSKAMSPANMPMPSYQTMWPDAPQTPSMTAAPSSTGPGSNEPVPGFPPSHTPDFLRSLTQVSENVGRSSEFVNVGKMLGGSPCPPSAPAPALEGGLRTHASPGTPQCPPSSGSNGPLTPASLPPSCPGSVSQTSSAIATGGSIAPGSNETTASSSQRTPATATDSAVGLDFDPMSVIDGDDQQDMMNLLPDNIGDLDFYLGGDGCTSGGVASAADDILGSLFDT